MNESKFRRWFCSSVRACGGVAQPIETSTLNGVPDVCMKADVYSSIVWLELKAIKGGNRVQISGAQTKWLKQWACLNASCIVLVKDAFSSQLWMTRVSKDSTHAVLCDLKNYYPVTYNLKKDFDKWMRTL